MKLRIKTTDSFGEKYDQTFKVIREDNNLGIKYSYTDGNTKVKIFILKDKLQILRDGEIKSNKILKKDQITNFSYKFSYMNRNFEISTKSLVIEEKKVMANYSILENQCIVNDLTLELEEL